MEVKEICKGIWKIEKEMNLMNEKICDVYFWELIRFKIYMEICKIKIGFKEAHGSDEKLNKNVKTKIIINCILHNPFFGKNKSEYIIFDHRRKPKIENKYIDIYTNYLIGELREDSLILEDIYMGEHFIKDQKNRKYTDFIKVMAKFYRKFNKIEFNKNEMNLINEINSRIYEIFDINMDIFYMVKKEISYHISLKKVYVKLLRRLDPKYIILVVSYFKKAICDAAKELGIPVLELQHGTITKYHLGYSYPNKDAVNYFPDYLLTYGEYWRRDYLPLPNERIINYGFRHFNERKKLLSNISKNEKQIVFISQGTIGEKLVDIFLDVSKIMKNYEFIYKLHPGEYSNWKVRYPKLMEASLLDNVVVVDNSNEDIYIYLKQSQFVVGVYSTVIFEALGFGCKGIVVDLPGIEYMHELIEMNVVKVAKNGEQIINLIEKGEFDSKFDSNYFFKEDVQSIRSLNI